MYLRKIIPALGIIILTTICWGAQLDKPSEEKVTLKQSFPSGKWELMRTTVLVFNMPTGGSKGGQASTTKSTMTVFAGLEVPEPDSDGIRNATWTCFRVIWNTEIPQEGPIVVDSAEDPNNPVISFYRPILGKKGTVVIDKHGLIVKVEGLDKPLDDKSREFPASKVGFDGVKLLLGNAAVKHLLSRVQQILPDVPVAVGDSWMKETSCIVPPAGTPVPGKSKCTLKKITKAPTQQVLIETIGSFAEKVPVHAGTPQQSDAKVVGTEKRQIWFDTSISIPVKQVITTEADIHARGNNGQIVKSRVTSEETVTIEKTKEFKEHTIPMKKKKT